MVPKQPFGLTRPTEAPHRKLLAAEMEPRKESKLHSLVEARSPPGTHIPPGTVLVVDPSNYTEAKELASSIPNIKEVRKWDY